MNDYKELIVKCEEWLSITKRLKADDLTQHIEMCADAIEHLVKERDELVTKLHQLEKERDMAMEDMRVSCGTCRHSYLNNASGNDCDSVGGCACNYSNWEWRGVGGG